MQSSEFDAGYEEGLAVLYEWIVTGVEETDEISLVLRYIGAELGWPGDDDEIEDGPDPDDLREEM